MSKFDTVEPVALTVTDVARSSDFYNRVFGTGGGDQLDPARVGLDYIGLHVSSRDDLEQWRERLDAQGVEHSGVAEDQFRLHLNVKDPDNIAAEFFVSAL